MIDGAVPQLRTIAGWPVGRVLVGMLVLAAFVWSAWATRTLLELERREIVSVSLAKLVEDFVAAEARNGGSPETTSLRTATYLAAVNRAIGELTSHGTTVIVSEATLGKSVPDRTAQVRARVTSMMEASGGAR